jgi:alkylation response protein AidB-like acyl-CoA dehydrogenase
MGVALETAGSLYPFVLNEEQEHLRREIRDFAAREIAPNVMAWDEASEFPCCDRKEAWRDGLAGRDLSSRIWWSGPWLRGLRACD